MSHLIVKPVATRREKKQFLSLPWTFYQGDPYWVPPLRAEQIALAGYEPHPFYETNQVQTFLALQGGRVCGRIAAVLNRAHNEYHSEERGFWGFFECIDDQQVADGLFGAVKAWFAQRGIHKLRGPANPSINYTVGLLVEGFDSPPSFMMTYNPHYYPKLVEEHGFHKTQDLYAYWGHVDWIPDLNARYEPFVLKLIDHFGIKTRPLDRSRFRAEIEEFLSIYNRSLAGTWGFVPLSRGEVQHIAAGMRRLLVPELAVVAEMDGKMIGAAFCLLDYNPRIKVIDGRLFPFGFLRLLLGKKNIKRLRLLSANVLPEYQRMGMGLVMLNALVPFGLDWGMQEAEISWVLESNMLSRGSLEKAGAKRIKTYRLYDLDTQPSGAQA